MNNILISINNATKRYGMTIPVLAGGETLASFVGGQSAIVRYDNLIISSFEFEKIDLDIVVKEILRLLLSEFGVDESNLPMPKITTPASPTNMNPLVVTGFVAPGSESVIVISDSEYDLNTDLEGFFVFESNLPEGSYTVQLKSKKGGKSSESVKTPLVIDRTPPEVIVLSPKNGYCINQEVEVIASCIGAKEARIDGVEVKISGDQISKMVPAGNGTIMLEAVDATGNKNQKILNYKPNMNIATDAKSSEAFFEISQVYVANVFGDELIFRPFQVATKGEVAVYLTKALGLEPEPGKCPYVDVPKDDASEPYIGALYEANVLSGVGEFKPNSNSTMEFLLQMISNRYGLTYVPTTPTFSDLDNKNPWYGGVEGCVKAKILNPEDARLFEGGSFNPGSGVKREEVAIILYWLLKYRARNGGE
ncbi:MAG: S-layer homology domain-containing protein [Caldisericia bacterium]